MALLSLGLGRSFVNQPHPEILAPHEKHYLLHGRPTSWSTPQRKILTKNTIPRPPTAVGSKLGSQGPHRDLHLERGEQNYQERLGQEVLLSTRTVYFN